MSRLNTNRFLIGCARFISAAMNPLLVPTYTAFLILWVSVLCAQPVGTRAMVMVVVACITCMIPMMAIGTLHHFHLIKDKQLNTARERRVPYAVTLVCVAAAALYLHYHHAPLWFTMALAGQAVACLLMALVNMWWKVCAHTAGMASIVAMLVQVHVQGLSAFNLLYLICGTVLLAGIVGSARLLLKRSTLAQILVGVALGYIPVAIAMILS